MADEVTITVRPNGPYRVEGPVKLVDADGNHFEVPASGVMTLCRCGHSNRKPFCDSTHRTIGFDAPTRVTPAAE